MNGSKNSQIISLNMDEAQLGSCTQSCSAAGIVAEQAAVEHKLERLQQYAAHLEGLLMRTNAELNRVQSVLAVRIDEEKQRHAVHEQIMIQQARKAAMGEMMGVVAHKWRQPLSAISLMVQNMKDAWEYGEFDEELLNQASSGVVEQVDHLSHTIDEFRSYLSPPGCGDYFSPKQCVKDAVILLSNCFSHFTTIEIQDANLQDDDLQVAGSHYGFQQVMHNLLRNANDAVQEQQHRIGADFAGAITISFQQQENDIVIKIADNGGGIPESIKEQIFDPLFTTKQNNKGLGVGLYVSRMIIENSMGGRLWSKNDNDGALFFVRLPILPAERRLT